MPNGLGKLVRNSRFLCPHYFIINIRINPLNLLTQPQKRILINSEHCGLLFYIKVNNIPSGISIIRNFIKICFNEYIISDNAGFNRLDNEGLAITRISGQKYELVLVYHVRDKRLYTGRNVQKAKLILIHVVRITILPII